MKITENCILVQGTSITFISILKDIIRFNRNKNDYIEIEDKIFSEKTNKLGLKGKFFFL